jgi:hypothetical protein
LCIAFNTIVFHAYIGRVLTKNAVGSFVLIVQCTYLVHKEHKTPNVVGEYLTLLLHIREVTVSYLGPETGYPDKFLLVCIIPSR